MRLLKREDTGEFNLTNFRDDEIPRYAILSHTWGADTEEVSFEDMIDGTGTSKPGYDKIRFCGEQVERERDDLQYFWIDTRCINKSNSTELQEAINSMFCWYRNADKCYVYLADVSRLTEASPVSRPGNHLFGRAGGSSGGGPFRSLLLRC
jgi:Heterokaryon incompatibility protein (HET)